ncbi:MAG: RtcB family protein [Chloroflexota bacterium]
MNTNTLLRRNGYSPNTVSNFQRVARRAAQLAKQPGATAESVMAQIAIEFRKEEVVTMHEKPQPYTMYGTPGIDFDYGVVQQMNQVSRLPVYASGAVLPDAHTGYALPIGGVAALHRAVSPYGVGVDIACRMCLTIFEDLTPAELRDNRSQLFDDLIAETRFGFGDFAKNRRKHPVMEEPLWQDRSLPLHKFVGKAADQLGSSGGGNHFADLVRGKVVNTVDWLPLPVGAEFTALLTHSGSRGVGYKMAKHYSHVAHQRTSFIARGIPKEYSWLSIDEDAGREYLEVMRLMGRYAQANHHLIHAHFLNRTGLSALPVTGTDVKLLHPYTRFSVIENHHNFAWVEDDLVIHRKGATPAGKGVAGLIPGSSGTASYIVNGLGNRDSLESTSHGAGRPFSRTEAKRRHDPAFFEDWMTQHDIAYHGVAADETLMAYKDIDTVIGLQAGVLVDVVAEMFPVAVRMGGKSDDGD